MRNVGYEIEGKVQYPRWNKHARIPVVNNARHQVYHQVWRQVSQQVSCIIRFLCELQFG